MAVPGAGDESKLGWYYTNGVKPVFLWMLGHCRCIAGSLNLVVIGIEPAALRPSVVSPSYDVL